MKRALFDSRGRKPLAVDSLLLVDINARFIKMLPSYSESYY
jgi:hypothetical protein